MFRILIAYACDVSRLADLQSAQRNLRNARHLRRLPGERERLGRRDKAIPEYRFVTDVWRHADPELQPYVEEAKAALQRLTGEPRK